MARVCAASGLDGGLFSFVAGHGVLNSPTITVQAHGGTVVLASSYSGVGQSAGYVTAEPRARRTDPATSHAAAAKAERFATTHAGRILAALRDLGTATAHELSTATGLTVVQIDRRTIELQRAGLAYVVSMDGDPLTRDGFRVWAAA